MAKINFMSRSHERGFPAHQQIRFDVLDFYRYAGALLVATIHFVDLHLPVALWIKWRCAGFQPLMGFFFTLSGFVIMHAYERRISTLADYIDYLKKRLARIYPLHIATLSFAIIAGLFVTHENWFNRDTILANILLIHAWGTTTHFSFNYPSWSVSAEFFVYLWFPALLLATNFFGSWGALLLSTICGLAMALLFKAYGLGLWTDATFDFGCLRALPSFLAGMAIYRLSMTQFSGLVVPAWLAHGLAVASVPMMLFKVSCPLMLAFFVVVVFALARAEPPTPGVFSKPLPRALANCSYGFYMLHAFVGAIMISIVPKIFHLDDAWVFGLAPAALVVTTVLALLSSHFFEIPARRYISAFRINAANDRYRKTPPELLSVTDDDNPVIAGAARRLRTAPNLGLAPRFRLARFRSSPG